MKRSAKSAVIYTQATAVWLGPSLLAYGALALLFWRT